VKDQNLTAGERVALHADIPWLILAPVLRRKWKEAVGEIDQDEAEESFKKFVKESRINSAEKEGKALEENYDELAANAWLVVNYDEYYDIPQNVQDVFDDDKININADSDKFWVLSAALKSFVAKEGNGKHLPLTGALPDMHGSTQNYLALQTIYKEKSNNDLKAFNQHLESVMKQVGKFNHFTEITITEVERFYKNTRFIEVQRYRSLEQEQQWNVDDLSILFMMINEDDNAKNIVWYLLFRAVDAFFIKNGRYPGDTDKTYEEDIKAVQELAQSLAKESNLDFVGAFPNLNDYAHEMTRYGAGELHNIASIVGGTVAQEVIKTVTGQWVSLNNTWVFNGINSSSLMFSA
jgi:NEDD8-activating enzyme E1 regulatory subunit